MDPAPKVKQITPPPAIYDSPMYLSGHVTAEETTRQTQNDFWDFSY